MYVARRLRQSHTEHGRFPEMPDSCRPTGGRVRGGGRMSDRVAACPEGMPNYQLLRDELRIVPSAIVACLCCYLALVFVFVALLASALIFSSDTRIDGRLRQAIDQGVLTR